MTWANDKLALHTWSLDTTPLGEALTAAVAGGFNAVELRRIDFVRCYEHGMSNAEVLGLIRACGMPVCTLGCEYGWMFATGAESRRLFQVLEETCSTARALGCRQLMSAPGPYSGAVPTAIANLRIAADMAAAHDLELAIEFNSQHEVVNNVGTLREVVSGAGRSNCGLLLDAYHLHRSRRPGRGFEEVPGAEIIAFQYSDCSANPVTGMKRPTDRLVPGQGRIDWTGVLGLLKDKGYRGFISYEAPNPELWARPPADVAREAAAATRQLLGAL